MHISWARLASFCHLGFISDPLNLQQEGHNQYPLEYLQCVYIQGAHPSGKSQGNLVFLQGQGKVREFCKMVREIRKSSKVREKSVNFKIMLG